MQLFNLPREGSTVFDVVYGPYKNDWRPRTDKNQNRYVAMKVAQAGVVFKWLCYEPFLSQAQDANLDRGDRVKVDVGSGELLVKKGAAVGSLPEVPSGGGGGGGGGSAPTLDFASMFVAYSLIHRMVGWSRLFPAADVREIATTLFIQWNRSGCPRIVDYPEVYEKLKAAGLNAGQVDSPAAPEAGSTGDWDDEGNEDEIPF